MLVGRRAEKQRLLAILDAARSGRGCAVVLRGEPGIGKTALLEDLRRSAAGFRVLTTRGVESESRLAFAGLSDVLRPVLDRLEAIPAAQRTALRAALALGPPAAPDRFAAYAAALSLIGAVARDGPLLILIDDAHWLDTPSQEALLFCARRIGDDPVAMVGTSRERPVEGLDLSGVTEIRIGGLDDDAARRLLETAAAPEPVAPAAAAALLELAGGNPLALVELPRALTADQRAGRAPVPRAPRAGDALTRAYRDRLEELAPAARRALTLAAVSDDGALGPIVAALEAGGGSAGDLVSAESAGFLALDAEAARMRHPLLRSVVLELVGPQKRRDAHAALASTLFLEGDAEQRAWHLAEAAVGPDEAAAAALESAAERAAARTGYAAAASAYERAARLSPAAPDAARRLLAAVGMQIAAGRGDQALALVDDLDGRPLDPALHAQATHLRGFLVTMTGNADEAFAILLAGARDIERHDPAAAAAMLADAGLTRGMAARCHEAMRSLDAARGLIDPSSPSATPVMVMFASALAMRGGAREARPIFERLDERIDLMDPLTPQAQSMAVALAPRVWLEDFSEARRHADRWTHEARASGCLAFLGFPLAFGTDIDVRTGRWDEGMARGLEAIRVLEETGQLNPLAFALVTVAVIEAARGREADCRGHVARAVEIGERQDVGSIRAYAGFVLGLLEQGLGRPAIALSHLEPLVAYVTERGLLEPATVPWQPDLVEAYVRLGRRTDARRVLATLADQAHRTGGTWARAVTCRGRGLIDDDIDRHFGEALALHALTPTPFERARTELAYGSRLRRARRRAEAREQLERALATFEGLGAEPWARQAREEIAAGGSRLRPRRDARPAGELSPRELQVALAVAEGLTNREAAARLFLSEKTVERHLGSVYRALGLRSRTELARRFAGGAPPPPPPESG